jgi:YD repeat-containing protein
MSYDDVGNLLSLRVEVDASRANDLVERYAYDGNDDPTVLRKPEGNRTFIVYDERRLRYRTFDGVAPGARIDEGYPVDKRAAELGGTPFVRLTVESYDARLNHVRHQDGRGNASTRLYDFRNRQVAESDPNGNGWRREYDDASNVLTTERGAVAPAAGVPALVLERAYDRFDEAGRRYQHVIDVDLETDERAAVDPDDGRSSSYRTRFDPGSRTVEIVDANGNPTSYRYDAAGRVLTATDALGNVRAQAYDANSNVVRVAETELPDAPGGGPAETYVRTFVHDELDRPVEEHDRGLGGDSIDHVWRYAYDSRHNRRLTEDPEGNVVVNDYDDADRLVRQRGFDGDPFAGPATQLLHLEWRHDRNGRVVAELALADVTDRRSAHVTRHAYDDLDRRVRTILPDSDDPVRGSGIGADARFDRRELRYDANSNLVRVVDQRGVVCDNSFDPGNRLVAQVVARPAAVPGTTRQAMAYDSLDRLVDARNDYARVERTHDPLSRPTSETQSIRLDGSGFASGWESPIRVEHVHDRQSNRVASRVLDAASTDLAVETAFDALNRERRIAAAYLGTPLHDVASYAYVGPWRVRTKTLGNGAVLTRTYDAKRRVRTHRWSGPTALLVGFEYDHDRMDNALFERFGHDGGLYDHFGYNDRYEVVAATYRAPDHAPPADPPTRFFYDDLLNRTQAVYADPLGARAATVDSYAVSRANEYTRVRRDGRAVTLAHDRAGNMTRLLLRPAVEPPPERDAPADARWDAFGLLFDVDTGVTPRQHYRYDPLRRRVAALELRGDAIVPGSRRYVYDGWEVVEERLFDGRATLAAAGSTLERVYVNGRELDEPLLAAIDGDGDGRLGGDTPRNVPVDGADQEYYFLDNRLGSVMALLDAGDADRVLERYRYTVYGETTVIPVVDGAGDGGGSVPRPLAVTPLTAPELP